MKITVVCDAIGSRNTEADVAAMTLVRAMKKRGHEVVVVCSDIDKAGEEGYIVISHRAIGNRFNEIALENEIWDSDAVYVMTASVLGRTAVRMCKRHLIPVCVDFDTQSEAQSARMMPGRSKAGRGAVYRRLYVRLYRYADAVCYPSESSRKHFEKAVGYKTNGYIIPNGAQLSQDKRMERMEEMLYDIR